jgi:exopolysaccharide biosynthesis polyprenyl glycosylphosphotransferase
MILKFFLIIGDAVLINLGFYLSFLVRFKGQISEYSFYPFRENFFFLVLINIVALGFFKVYESRFRSFWNLWEKIFSGLVCGEFFSIVFIYIFRGRWIGFPTSIFIISFFINLCLIFIFNSYVLKRQGGIRKRIVIVGKDGRKEADFIEESIYAEKKWVEGVEDFIKDRDRDIDEVIICEDIKNNDKMDFLLFCLQKLKVEFFFSPSLYRKLIAKEENNNEEIKLNTFLGKKSDSEEFLIRSLDVMGSFIVFFVSLPLMLFFAFLIKVSSPGDVFFKQKRVGKDGKVFTLYKFRTMIKDAEKMLGLVPALQNDSRVTKVGRFLRRTRLDELPQVFNVLKGDMSLVGPRPENLYRVKLHKEFRGIRIAVKPGITGLAQIRSFYDLKPGHKIRYDYLYIQRRSFFTNIYILAQTIPALFIKKGW